MTRTSSTRFGGFLRVFGALVLAVVIVSPVAAQGFTQVSPAPQQQSPVPQQRPTAGPTVFPAQQPNGNPATPDDADEEEIGTFDVEGQITNGTAGADLPLDIELKIVAFADDQIRGSWDAEMDEEGYYWASEIPRTDGVTYVLATEYQGVAHVVQIIPPDDEGPAIQDMMIFEAVDTNPGLRFDQSAVILTEINEAARSVTVTELHTIINPSDRTFAPQMGGPGGAAGLLVFGLPPNSFDLTPGLGLDPSQLVEIGLGFASLSPIFPGRREVSFSYRFPYASNEARFDRTIRYPVESVRVLARMPGPEIKSQSLPTSEVLSIGGTQYRILSGGPLNPGSMLSFTVNDLPVPGGAMANVPPTAPALIGAFLGLAVIVFYWRRTRQSRLVTADVDDEDSGILDRLVALDLERTAGRISEEEYQRTRDALLAAAHSDAEAKAGHLRAQPGEEAH